MQITADADLRLAIFTAEPSSSSEQALNLHAGWTATRDELPTNNRSLTTRGARTQAT